MTAIHSLANHALRRATPVPYVPVQARRVLVPVDGSRRSLDLLRLAVEWARTNGEGEVHGVCVVEEPVSDAGFIHRALYPNSDPSTVLAKLEARLESQGLAGDVELSLVTGAPARAIARAADRLGCDLILLPRETRNPLSRWLSRGLTERVMQRATCSVLVVCDRTLQSAG